MNIVVKDDQEFRISIGRNRKETKWKNQFILWSDFLKRISKPHRTTETVLEYAAMPKAMQDEKKDVGGYVFGNLRHGRRKAANVGFRSVLALDIDFGSYDFWDLFIDGFEYSCTLYSTHKHTKDNPRYRLLIPLDKDVPADQYEAIARRVAGDFDIEVFDPTTFQAERLMHFPSCSIDGEYVFEYQDGPLLDAEEVLRSYVDWRDVSEWPVSIKVSDIIERAKKNQGDPTKKPGPIGAFCRSYGIADAIEKFIPDYYIPSKDDKDRYTYREGSTSGGLVIYDDMFAYSHHATDPASHQLCNAFDLVRLQLYSDLDKDYTDETTPTKLPSYKAMLSFIKDDKNVIREIVDTKLKDSLELVSLLYKDDDPEKEGEQILSEIFNDDDYTDDWKENFKNEKNGDTKNCISNVALIILNDKAFRNIIAYDVFENRAVALKNLPWRKITEYDRFLTDDDDNLIRAYIESAYDLRITVDTLAAAMSVVAQKTKFHPVRDYLSSLEWDHVPRIDKLFIDYFDAEDSKYTRAVARKMCVAAVKRVFEPGCKFDYMVTLVGNQGVYKSTFCQKLAIRWFSDSISTVTGKESFEQLRGVWIGEMAELSAFKKAEQSQIKHYITKGTDRYRPAYGRKSENFPRQSILIASTNERGSNKDQTGGRRYWYIVVGPNPRKLIADIAPDTLNQIWAEAMVKYQLGETVYLDKVLEAEAALIQEVHTEADPRNELIEKYLSTKVPYDWGDTSIRMRKAYLNDPDSIKNDGMQVREKISAPEIWIECFNGETKEMTRHQTDFIHTYMKKHSDWIEMEQKQRVKQYGILKSYKRREKLHSDEK